MEPARSADEDGERMNDLAHALVINALPPAPPSRESLPRRPLPLGALWLAAAGAESGYRIGFIDTAVAGDAEPGSGVEALTALVDDDWPLLAVSCMSAALPMVLLAVTEFRSRHPEPLVVLGGPGPSAVGRDIIERFSAVDAVCSGAGEQVFGAIVAAAQYAIAGNKGEGLRRLAQLPGLWVRSRGRAQLNHRPIWVELPEAVRRLAPALVDRSLYSPSAPLVSAFGCLHMCDFCSIDSFWPRPVWRDPENVARDAVHLAFGLGYRSIDILDDCFALDEPRMRAIIDHLRTFGLAGADHRLTWSCQARADRMDEALLDFMAESGCRRVSLGIESGSARVLRIVRKGLRVPEAVAAVRRAAGRMAVDVSLLFGFPYESAADFDETRRLFVQLSEIEDVTPTLRLVTPYADSPLYDAFADCLEFSPELLPLSFNAYAPGVAELELAAASPAMFPDFFHFTSPDLAHKVEAARELTGASDYCSSLREADWA
jgi:anaerobic magnesium-protoporphyrin IX monomethyl ester cyclase